MELLEIIIIIAAISLIEIIIAKLLISDSVSDVVIDNEILKKQRDNYLETVKNQHKLIEKQQLKIKNYKKLVTSQQGSIRKYKSKNKQKAVQIEKLQQSQKNQKYQIESLKTKRDKLKEENLKLIAKNIELNKKLDPNYYIDKLATHIDKMNKEDSDPYLLDKRLVE